MYHNVTTGGEIVWTFRVTAVTQSLICCPCCHLVCRMEVCVRVFISVDDGQLVRPDSLSRMSYTHTRARKHTHAHTHWSRHRSIAVRGGKASRMNSEWSGTANLQVDQRAAPESRITSLELDYYGLGFAMSVCAWRTVTHGEAPWQYRSSRSVNCTKPSIFRALRQPVRTRTHPDATCAVTVAFQSGSGERREN